MKNPLDVRVVLSGATQVIDQLSPDAHASRIPSTPAPDYAAGLAFHSRGHGPPVLLIHGLAASRAAYNPVFDALSRRHHVIAVDLPGHGDSDPMPADEPITPRAQAFALGEFLDALGIEEAHIVGNSMGGWIGMEMAADRRALSYTGFCPAGLWEPFYERPAMIEMNRALARATGRLGELMMAIPPIREFVFGASLERPYRVDFGLARSVAAAQRGASNYDEACDGMLGLQFERADAIPRTVPVTVAFGDNDVLLPNDTCQIQQLAPRHSNWVVMPRVGHVPMWEDPEGALSLIQSTVQRAG